MAAGLMRPNLRTTVGEFLTSWLADIVPDSVDSVNTVDNYRWAVNLHLVPALGHRPLVKLTPADVVDMLRSKINAGMSRNSVMRLRSILASALDQGSSPLWKLVSRESFERVTRSASGRRRHQRLLWDALTLFAHAAYTGRKAGR